MEADHTCSSSPGGQNEMDDEPLEKCLRLLVPYVIDGVVSTVVILLCEGLILMFCYCKKKIAKKDYGTTMTTGSSGGDAPPPNGMENKGMERSIDVIEDTLTTSAEDNVNPLNNNDDAILPKTLYLLPLQDLKAERSVSRRLNHDLAAKPFLDFCSSAQICFCDSRGYYSHLRSPWAPEDHIPHGIGDMAPFTQDVRTRGTCSFRRIDLGMSVMRKEGSTSVVTDFFSVCGPYIEELNVWKGYHEPQIKYEQVLLTSPLTSLRVLRVSVSWTWTIRDHDSLGNFFDFVWMIIQESENLESLTLRLHHFLSEGQVTNSLIPPLRMCNLVNLELSAKLNAEHFIALSGIQGLRLKSLDLVLLQKIDDPGPFQQFLESQSGSLEALCLSGFQGYVIEFPRMRSLKSLELDDIYGFFTFPTLSYPSQFPSLETLIVHNCCPALDHQLIDPDLRPCLTLKKLVIRRTVEDGMRIVVSLFPNVKRLEVPCNWMPKAYSLMPQLEELTFVSECGWYHGDLIDDLITGIPNYECEHIHREGNYEAVLRNLFQRRTPSITCLKRLRTLRLSISESSPLRITEASFHLALFHMESLKTLDLGYTSLTQISSACMEAIRKRFQIKMKNTYETQD